MNLADFLRRGLSPMNQQAMADNQQMSLAGELSKHGSLSPTMEALRPGLAGSVMEAPERQGQREQVMGEIAMSMMPGVGITAFHGSPHKFSKFDMSKIGTGEGAQAYGHGLYFAENPAVAQEYADELSRTIKVGGNTLQGKGSKGTTGIEDVDDYLIADRGDASLALSNMKKDRLHVANSSYPENATSYDAGIEMLEGMVQRGEVQNTTAGNFYKVDIPDDQIANMLDWDKPLSEQPQILQDMARTSDLSAMPEGNRTRRLLEKWRDGTEQAHYPATGHTFYNSLSDYGQGSVPELSQKLYEAGIPGIKYLDGGSRTGGKGTSNFVLFSDEIAKILERNGQPIGDLAGTLSK